MSVVVEQARPTVTNTTEWVVKMCLIEKNELRLQEASSIIGFSNRFKIPKKFFNDCLSIVIDCFSYFCDKMRESSCTEAVRSVLSYFLYLKSVF